MPDNTEDNDRILDPMPVEYEPTQLEKLYETRRELAKRDTALTQPITDLVVKGREINTALAKLNTSLTTTKSSLSSKNAENSIIQGKITTLEGEIDGINASIAAAFAGAAVSALFDFGIGAAAAAVFASGARAERVQKEEAAVKLERTKHSTSSLEQEATALTKQVEGFRAQLLTTTQGKTEAELNHAYRVVVDQILNEQAIRISIEMEKCARNAGTDLDRVLQAGGPIAEAFVNATVNREMLETVIDWSRSEQGNVSMPPELMALRQFVNQVVIPHQDYFEILASKNDDLQNNGRNGYPPLEVLQMKPVSLSGRRQLPAPPRYNSEDERKASERRAEAAKQAKDMVPVIDWGNAMDASQPVTRRLNNAVQTVENRLGEIDDIFAGIQERIDKLTGEEPQLATTKLEKEKILLEGKRANTKIDGEIDKLQTEITTRKAMYAESNKGLALGIALPIGRKVVMRAGAGAVAGSVIPGIGTVAGGIFGAIEGLVEGAGNILFEGKSDSTISKMTGYKLSANEEFRIKEALIANLKTKKVDVIAHAAEIQSIANKIEEIVVSKKFQEMLTDEVKSERVVQAYVARSLLRSGSHNTQELQQSCEISGVSSVDSFLTAFDGRLGEALQRFCFGIANSNDMRVIIAEANGVKANDTDTNRRALRDFAEDVLKPDIGAYLTHASKVDKIYQANLIGLGTQLHWEREMVRDTTDRELTALFANEFGMSVVGVQDIRNIFDSYLHRHGDKYMYDAKLKDGQMTDEYPDMRVNVVPEERMDRFVDMVKRSAAHARTTQPNVGDMFLRICGYEYFRPQAVRTAGTDNIFLENPEAPASYPMVNEVVNNFIERLSLSPIETYREQVGVRLDSLIARSFMDFFARLGEIHGQDEAIDNHRKRTRDAARADQYGSVFSSYTRRITADAVNHYDLFLDIYKENLERVSELAPEKDRKLLQAQIEKLSEPARTTLNPDVMDPTSHQARLTAAYEDHLFENMRGKGGGIS